MLRFLAFNTYLNPCHLFWKNKSFLPTWILKFSGPKNWYYMLTCTIVAFDGKTKRKACKRSPTFLNCWVIRLILIHRDLC